MLLHPSLLTPNRPLHLGTEDLGHPGREEPFSDGVMPAESVELETKTRVPDEPLTTTGDCEQVSYFL